MARGITRVRSEWNTNVYKDRTYTDNNGFSYCLKHMKNMRDVSLKYEFRSADGKKQKGTICVDIVFDHHCYTRERGGDDQDLDTLVVDQYSDGSAKDRVFDLKRYKFTRDRLVPFLKNISYQMCRASRIHGKAIRFDGKDKKNPMRGIYILMKLKNNKGKLVLYIETCHERTNEPFSMELEKRDERYMLILGRWLHKLWPELIPIEPK